MSYWLLKTEPETFGINDLKKLPSQTTPWEGVRNYQARNMLRDEMHKEDLGFFYHSSCKIPGIVGVVKVVRAGYPDPTQWDPKSIYYDPKSSIDQPRWFLVDVKLIEEFNQIISLSELRSLPQLKDMQLLQRGNRLSVMPVTKQHWDIILSLKR